jgi:DNA modification methylase
VKPYYDHGGITIYHGDCREILPELSGISQIVTDPPYGIGDRPLQGEDRTGKRTGAVNTWHPPSGWDADFPSDAARACGDAADVVAWFGHWRMRAKAEAAVGLPLRAEIVWNKGCHTAPPSPVAPCDERLWLFSASKIEPRCFDVSVWNIGLIPTWEKKLHKNEKPVSLMSRVLRLLCDGSSRVCDPFMGSGTTLRAAKDLGFKAIGIDIDDRYCEIAAKRLSQEVLYPALARKEEE